MPIFSQTGNITDYFPVTGGNIWTYANAAGKTSDVIIMRNSTPDNISNDGTSLYLFEHQFAGTGTGSTLYSIKQNKIVIMAEKNIRGQYQEKNPPFPILALAGQEWRYNDRGDDLRYKSSKSSCVFDGKTFNDCILAEEQIVYGQNVLRTKKSYYAKGIGLVYVTLQEAGKEESCYQKLIDCNFADIKTANVNNKISQFREDLTTAEMFFIINFAENGLDLFSDMESKRETLDNNTQKSIFNALCTLAGNNISNILTMANSGDIKIKTYLNSPMPDFLLTIHLGNKFFSTAVDKAVKILVLSNVLNFLQDKLKNSIPDQRYLKGTKEAEPLLSNLYNPDSSVNDDEYKNIAEPLYREFIDLYLRHGGT
jgi:hypothetical protein